MNLLTTLYILSACVLALYTLGHGILLVQYLRKRGQGSQADVAPLEMYPPVTVQLPVYNERHVALRLIDAVAMLDYPADKLQIQILDDSTDSTTGSIARHIRQYAHLDIMHVRRPKREGYKAGALAYGLTQTTAPYVAIFDADFIPANDFLQRTIPYLEQDGQLGFVQTRWGHLNPTDNALTRAQVIAIDNHFVIEQAGRHLSEWMVPFNGTGGVWRVETIADAGGWSARTLTEDLDLSFRAQLKGWRVHYLPDLVVPGELPPQLAAYRQQQARWAKGGSQCLRKLGTSVWASDKRLSTKLIATHHLMQYVPQLLMLVMLLLTPLLIISDMLRYIPLAPLGIIGLIPPVMYVVSQQAIGGRWLARLAAFPALLLLGTGLIWQNAIAVVSGFFLAHGEFRRTPKFASDWQASGYALRAQVAIVVQIAFMVYSAWGLSVAWQAAGALVPYFGVHVLSFGLVALWDIHDEWRLRQAMPKQQLLPESGSD
ncbi:MAG: glycosyltransferase [Chloroflexota bacterium]